MDGRLTGEKITMSRILFAALAASLTLTTAAVAADAPGVTATEIKVGATFPFSGPASSLGNAGKGLIAYVNQVNDRGGINGRKINLITYDDAYSPPKAVEHTRKLIESDEVSFMFGQLGTPSNSATIKYLTGIFQFWGSKSDRVLIGLKPRCWQNCLPSRGSLVAQMVKNLPAMQET